MVLLSKCYIRNVDNMLLFSIGRETMNPETRLGEIFDSLNAEKCSKCLGLKEITIRINRGSINDLRIKTPLEFDIPIQHGCCSGCGMNNGYFNSSWISVDSNFEITRKMQMEQFDRVKSIFHTIYGFFDPYKKQCKLDRKDRSYICNHYRCPSMNDKLKKKFGVKIEAEIESLAADIAKNQEKANGGKL